MKKKLLFGMLVLAVVSIPSNYVAQDSYKVAGRMITSYSDTSYHSVVTKDSINQSEIA